MRGWRPISRAGGGHTLLLIAGAAAGAAFLTVLQVPAGILIGSVVGSALANRVHRLPAGQAPPAAVRVVGLVLLGCAAGVRLDAETLTTLGAIAAPLLASIVVLLVLDLALAALLVRRYDVDPLTAVLACAPGGISELAVTASQLGAQMGVVLAVHMVRVVAVVLVALPLLVLLLGPR